MAYTNALANKLADTDFTKFRVLAGFDAITDVIVRPIKEIRCEGIDFYSGIEEFGLAIASKKTLSGLVSLKREMVKPGGNMTNYACALGTLGVAVDCFGSFGLPDIEEVFLNMPPSCSLHSIGKAFTCTALEFRDGKLMLADYDYFNSVTWESLQDLVKGELEAACGQCGLAAMANWSELKNATEIWSGMLGMLRADVGNKKTVSIDITDFSYRSKADVEELVELLLLFCKQTRCILTFNKNESFMLFRLLFQQNSAALTFSQVCSGLYEYFSPYAVVVHNAHGTYARSEQALVSAGSYFTSNSKISTGAGDSFNAGLSAGVLCGFSIEDSIKLAAAVSGYYVRMGKCPGVGEVCEFIETNQACAVNFN